MRIENILIGILLLLIGIIGAYYGISSRLKMKDDVIGSTLKLIFGSIGLLTIGLFLIIKELVKIF
jgi:hypothetical protein